MVKKEDIRSALANIIDPDFGKDIVSLGFIKELEVEGPHVLVGLELTTPACPVKDQFKADAERLVKALPGVETVTVNISSQPQQPRRSPVKESGLADIGAIIAVASCKGGVGKSTVAAGLAAELASRGYKVGLLDLDIFGPSVPTLFGLHGHPLRSGTDNQLLPIDAGALKVMSFGFWLGDAPAVMRGPMVTNYVQQFLHGVAWGDLDYLFIDFPPGTGDVQLTITQSVQLDGAVIVTTPQALAVADVGKGIVMFDKVNVPVLGVVENMAFFEDPSGARHEIFGHGGGDALAGRFGIEVLHRIPLAPDQFGGSFANYTSNPLLTEATDAVIRALGRAQAAASAPPLVEFDDQEVRLTWPDKSISRVSNRKLRASCRCAVCVNEFTGEQYVEAAKVAPDIKAEQVKPIGNYALSVTWSDGHATGLFPYRTLRELAEHLEPVS